MMGLDIQRVLTQTQAQQDQAREYMIRWVQTLNAATLRDLIALLAAQGMEPENEVIGVPDVFRLAMIGLAEVMMAAAKRRTGATS